MTTVKLVLATVAGENCITLEQGDKVYGAIYPALKAGQPVELDFAGVKVFASPFFNAAIGRLLRDLDAKDLNRLLKVEHLSPVGLDVWRHVVENSKEYYANPQAREAIDKIVSDQPTE